MNADLPHDQHYECNHCDWDGPRDETVHPKHDASLLLCPKCHETLCAVEQPTSDERPDLIRRLVDLAEGGFDLDFTALDKITPEVRRQCIAAEELAWDAKVEIERLRKLLDGRTFVSDEPAVTPKDYAEACAVINRKVREIEILANQFGIDPGEWLVVDTGQDLPKSPAVETDEERS